MGRKAFWGLIAAALIVTPAVIGLLVMGGGSDSRSKAALVAEGTGAGYELVVAGLTPPSQAVDVVSYSWEVKSPVSATTGATTGRAQFGNLVISKKLDETSPLFVEGAATGKNYATAALKLYKGGGGGKPVKYATYALTNARVVHVTHGGTSDNIPTEEVELAYSKLSIEISSIDESGKVGTPTKYEYDAAKGGA